MLLKPVGIIHSPFKEKKDSPHQGRYGDQTSEIHIFDEYLDALEVIEKYKNLIILYWFDKVERDLLKVIPFGKSKKRGIFSTRAPSRPNPISFSLVDLLKLKQNRLTVKGLEALDGSLVVDIKPYWKDIDCLE
ncbi:MAG: tRNA (N6-threonylcarbamoyladenosine(37)-N6)-methyltransferase TrmO [Methanobacteriaceae archaeon]|nr:tRNA (N6-threonylcarbamoyladenosine(37)-N6)-methyltransferase TrmO [Methanobacteriaceae archaeon]MDP2836766.1 tRNA (N6-threonylcarbamoyladenosine(37)-N6)-methyltransferase TrmO [Methanobacteriaceae archaeon]MDP3033955.1 tRNA (N6-threonylcarbamoyladenosine(37)-N6)-methyltransferase TrmO [Methanobacteriaceae archaeon]MDP3486030.1 tRNA (N6-threonylcarbamoyladenosine(37)-N6)-methyltransferase TrmO [Methanobacteriaceae archaeon]MDP3624601.1 tRNA (N6-threonylcarbamoyladenosine(37)-N6)-methyltransf